MFALPFVQSSSLHESGSNCCASSIQERPVNCGFERSSLSRRYLAFGEDGREGQGWQDGRDTRKYIFQARGRFYNPGRGAEIVLILFSLQPNRPLTRWRLKLAKVVCNTPPNVLQGEVEHA